MLDKDVTHSERKKRIKQAVRGVTKSSCSEEELAALQEKLGEVEEEKEQAADGRDLLHGLQGGEVRRREGGVTCRETYTSVCRVEPRDRAGTSDLLRAGTSDLSFPRVAGWEQPSLPSPAHPQLYWD